MMHLPLRIGITYKVRARERREKNESNARHDQKHPLAGGQDLVDAIRQMIATIMQQHEPIVALPEKIGEG